MMIIILRQDDCNISKDNTLQTAFYERMIIFEAKLIYIIFIVLCHGLNVDNCEFNEI